MPKLEVAPTRSNLLRARESLQQAQEGYDLLDQKREVLLMELMQMVHNLRELERQVEEKSAAAFDALESALLSMGNESVRWAALSVIGERGVSLLHRSVMGVPLVSVQEATAATVGLQASPEGTGPALDEARRRFEELVSVIYDWSEVEASVWKLASEIRKTQRRVNALENIFIPKYEETVKAIEEILEESDREEFIRKKKVKSVLKRQRAKGKEQRARS
jgi:V/A-type H+-transporting ATPase subunit D